MNFVCIYKEVKSLKYIVKNTNMDKKSVKELQKVEISVNLTPNLMEDVPTTV